METDIFIPRKKLPHQWWRHALKGVTGSEIAQGGAWLGRSHSSTQQAPIPLVLAAPSRAPQILLILYSICQSPLKKKKNHTIADDKNNGTVSRWPMIHSYCKDDRLNSKDKNWEEGELLTASRRQETGDAPKGTVWTQTHARICVPVGVGQIGREMMDYSINDMQTSDNI